MDLHCLLYFFVALTCQHLHSKFTKFGGHCYGFSSGCLRLSDHIMSHQWQLCIVSPFIASQLTYPGTTADTMIFGTRGSRKHMHTVNIIIVTKLGQGLCPVNLYRGDSHCTWGQKFQVISQVCSKLIHIQYKVHTAVNLYLNLELPLGSQGLTKN